MSAPARGFALIVTIVLVAFLVLLLVGLATFTRVETQVATNGQNLAQARQNALFALNLAVGQLQRHTGPDQRVTATADLQPLPTLATVSNNPPAYPTADPASGASLSGTTAAATTAIDAYWRSGRNRRWTGAWANANSNAFDADNPYRFNRVPGLQSWLVSGNESAADTFRPTDVITGLSFSTTPFDALEDSAGRPHRLLLKRRAGVEDADNDGTPDNTLDHVVTAPEIPITASNVPGQSGPAVVGHYAWWVGDEGVKARANLADAHLPVGTTDANRIRFQSAQRPAVEVISGNFTELDPSQNANHVQDFKSILESSQLRFLDPASAPFATDLKVRHHDLTIHSRGVLADVRNGGLKSDLSYLFSQPNIGDFRTALRQAYHGAAAIAPNTLAGTSNTAFSVTATPYATLPSNVGGSAPAYNGPHGILDNSSTWEQLWSFYNIGNLEADAPAGVLRAGEFVPRRQTNQQHGLHPMLVQAKLFYGLRTEGGTVRVDVTPVIVLANPYNVKIAPADYVVRFSTYQPRLRFAATTDISDPQYSNSSVGQVLLPAAFTAMTRFVIRCTAPMEAGKAYVFTLDPSGPGMSGGRFAFDATTAAEPELVNDFDPTPVITYDSGFSLPRTLMVGSPAAPVAMNYAALVGASGNLYASLYMRSDFPGADDAQLAIHGVFGQAVSDVETVGLFFLVRPIAAGESRVGGGVILVINEAPTGASDNYRPQQAPFYQVNYRGPWINYSGFGGSNHAVEWARTFIQHSDTAGGAAVNPWLAAHLMFEGADLKNTRWGIVNYCVNAARNNVDARTLTPPSIGGSSAGNVGFENYLYDVPRRDLPIASLGQLQHFNTAGFLAGHSSYSSQNSPSYNKNMVHSWQVNYAPSNSYANPRVPREQVFFSLGGTSYHYDGSTIWNDLLWDRFYFSTFPQRPGDTFDFNSSTQRLANARYRPFRDPNVVPRDDVTAFRGDGSAATAGNSRIAAQNLLVEGAFNINSTSVAAWKAQLSSLRNIPFGIDSNTTPQFSRTLYPRDIPPDNVSNGGGSLDAHRGVFPNSWNGFRRLTDAQIEDIAEEMVMQVRKRGPFLSMADFVNRAIITSGNDTLDIGLKGALQAAIDQVINLRNDVDAPFRALPITNMGPPAPLPHGGSPQNAFLDREYIMSNGLAGFPGYLLQGDVLSALGPTLSARSDTFVIRTYGDAFNPAADTVVARAWCEAVVQRLPDYIDATTPATDRPAAGSTNERFGRRYQIVSFRWLGPDDI